MTNVQLAMAVTIGSFVLGMGSGAWIDHSVMSLRIDKLNAIHSEEIRQREVQRAADEAKARANERQMTEAVGLAEQEKTDEIAKVRSAAAYDIARLQNRPDRKPTAAGSVPQASAACAGSTGLDLSRRDSEFLVGVAQRADEQRSALSACYKAYDAIGQ